MNNKEELYERARKNSVGEEKKVRYVKMQRDAYIKNLKTTFFAGAMIAILASAALAYGGHTLSENLSDAKVVRQEISDYSNLVNSETHRTNDNEHYFYDTADIASKLTEDQNNIDKGIFGVYKNIGYNQGNKIEQMNDVIDSMAFEQTTSENKTQYDNFNDYVVSKGYIGKDGKADYDAYEKAMTQMIVNEHNIEELQSQVDEVKSR